MSNNSKDNDPRQRLAEKNKDPTDPKMLDASDPSHPHFLPRRSHPDIHITIDKPEETAYASKAVLIEDSDGNKKNAHKEKSRSFFPLSPSSTLAILSPSRGSRSPSPRSSPRVQVDDSKKGADAYQLDTKQIEERYRTSITQGLTIEEAEKRLHEHGKNEIQKGHTKSVWKMLLGQVVDFMMLVLFVAAILSFVMQDWADATVILIVIICNVLIGFTQEYKAEQTIAAMQQLTAPHCQVIRGGNTSSVEAPLIVPGDLIVLEEGNQVPADIRLVEVTDLQIEESILTGESLPVEKTTEAITSRNVALGDRVNMAFMGTIVTAGRAKGIVVATGKDTQTGIIARRLYEASAEEELTPLQKKLERLGKWLVLIASTLCALVGVIGIIEIKLNHEPFNKENLFDILKTAVSLATAAIPEGLVAVVTVTMALGVNRMAKRNAIVRKLPAAETLGSVTAICSDKTGTLTQGVMVATTLWLPSSDFGEKAKKHHHGIEYVITGIGVQPRGSIFVASQSGRSNKHPTNKEASSGPSSSFNAADSQHHHHLRGSQEDSDKASDDEDEKVKDLETSAEHALLREAIITCSLCNNSAIEKVHRRKKKDDKSKKRGDEDESHTESAGRLATNRQGEEWEGIGDPTEVALTVLAAKAGLEKEYIIFAGEPKPRYRGNRRLRTDIRGKSKYKRPKRKPITQESKTELLRTLHGDIEEAGPMANVWKFMGEVPFETKRKRMTVVYRNTKDDKVYAFTKGATEAILTVCSKYLVQKGSHRVADTLKPYSEDQPIGGGDDDSSSGGRDEEILEERDLTDELRKKIMKKSESFAGKGLRVIALAKRELGGGSAAAPTVKEKEGNGALEADAGGKGKSPKNKNKNEYSSEEVERDLTFIGFVALSDPPREEAKKSVQEAHQAGIDVFMITGDHPSTARHIALELGIIPEDDPEAVMIGSQLDEISDNDESLARHLDRVRIFARTSPDNKIDIVKALKKKGHVVAMTGDGVNDAPSIKAADVGIAMGKAGSDVAKQAADIVLTDDNFSTIVVAVEMGRNILDNIQKFMIYLLSCNTGEIFVMLFAQILSAFAPWGTHLPLSAIQILWLNLVTDTPPAFAIGVEPPEPDIMLRPPRDPLKGIFSADTATYVIIHGLAISLLTLGVFLYFDLDQNTSLGTARTCAFSTLALLEIVQAFNVRNSKRSIFKTGIFGNKTLVLACLISTGMMLLGIYVRPIARVLDMEPIAARHWTWICGSLLVFEVFAEAYKLAWLLVRRFRARRSLGPYGVITPAAVVDSRRAAGSSTGTGSDRQRLLQDVEEGKARGHNNASYGTATSTA